ncbi:quercetin dioxygenase-like cupin family protein [Microbacterium sp. W4I4]|uniref:cupin domain-containing protein n=1 Tax=Microbacterium sp. W4I4 TaxID=3042295 RepID=UPI002781B76E|nr:cupin domain-containing protein [Microbacterium sp. W4I4]MDQ0614066.1 quercetin dioxygenase-like cupin family protein [Microbacterium sp. W4I4]
MKYASTENPEYRNGEWGPAYLVNGSSSDIGVLMLRPGDEVENHFHNHCDETFIALEGECTLWIERAYRHTMRTGDVYRCEPGEHHYLINETGSAFRLLFIKSPSSPGDTHAEPWNPRESASGSTA